MWLKIRRLLLLLPLALILLMPLAVYAATSSDIIITATGYICGSPSGLTLVYISDYEIGISWLKGLNADNTLIRAAYGRYPETVDDGYLVYFGAGASCSDTGVQLNETVQGIYYRAWSEKGGIFAPLYDEGTFMEHVMLIGNTLFIILLSLLPLILMVITYRTKLVWIAFPTAILWLTLALHCNGLVEAEWDTYYIIRMLGIVMIFVTIVFAVYIRTRVVNKAENNEVIEEGDEFFNDYLEQYKEVQKYRKLGVKPRKRSF